MMRYFQIIVIIFFSGSFTVSAQETLPNISVRASGNNVIVSWKNAYKVPISNLLIQRSYDSLQNYTTIGSVLSPGNEENGYSDVNPPYNKMYYRAFVVFEGGSYIYSLPTRPQKDDPVYVKTIDGRDSLVVQERQELQPWQINPALDSNYIIVPGLPNVKPQIKRIMASADNSIMLALPAAETKKYKVRFYDENEKLVFELNNIKDEFLVIEKVNFRHSGMFRYEILEDGIVIEKNSVFVPKDVIKKN